MELEEQLARKRKRAASDLEKVRRIARTTVPDTLKMKNGENCTFLVKKDRYRYPTRFP